MRPIAAIHGCSDCPTPQTLGEYALGMLAGTRRAETLRHVLVCWPCAEELRVLRAFLLSEAREEPPPVAKAPSALCHLVAAALTALASVVPRPAPAIVPR